MKRFKERWEIERNWQLLFPVLGIVGLLYSGIKIGYLFTDNLAIIFFLALAFIVVAIKICLFIFKKLEGKWKVNARWEFIRIFIVFAITGSSSMLLSRPLIRLIGINKDSLNIFLYYLLFIFVSLIVYQIVLVIMGWVFGQFQFFWEFEKKMLRRLGIKIL